MQESKSIYNSYSVERATMQELKRLAEHDLKEPNLSVNRVVKWAVAKLGGVSNGQS